MSRQRAATAVVICLAAGVPIWLGVGGDANCVRAQARIVHLPSPSVPLQAVADDRANVYVACFEDESVLRLSGETGAITARARLECPPNAMAYDRSAGLLLATNEESPVLWAIDLGTMQISRRQPVGSGLGGLAVKQGGGEYCVCDWKASRIIVLASDTWHVKRAIRVPQPPLCLVQLGASSTYAVGCGGGGPDPERGPSMCVFVDVDAARLVGTVRLPGCPVTDIAYWPAREAALVLTTFPEHLFAVTRSGDAVSAELLLQDFAGTAHIGDAHGILVDGSRAFISTTGGTDIPEGIVEVDLTRNEWRPLTKLGNGKMTILRLPHRGTELVVPGSTSDTVSFVHLRTAGG